MLRRRGMLLWIFGAVAGCTCSSRSEQATRLRSLGPGVPIAPALPASDLSEDELRRVIATLRPLHEPLPSPQPGDWLAEHDEDGQSFHLWLRSGPVTADVGAGREGERRVLYVRPLGPLSVAQRRIVELSADYMGRFFSLETRVLEALPLSLLPARARRVHPTWRNPQILASHVLEELMAPALPDDAAAYICFTASDLWPGAGWNFVFGQASLRDRVGVWSLHRNGDPEASEDEFRRVLLRTLKIAVHETGHMFSMEHCTSFNCVMAGANSLAEADRHPLWVCPECLAKVSWATRADPVDRYRKLGQFALQHGLQAEAAFFERSGAALSRIRK